MGEAKVGNAKDPFSAVSLLLSAADGNVRRGRGMGPKVPFTVTTGFFMEKI